ncbi:acyl-CoA dehydrogenase family protein [Parafrankia sp. BMG5.11]|uniref:acyl-CoA dehydrogenase family protein n=1 Tax=Parafrankia sp. BMG5.11 TaxID=222540 RepID=UPI0010406BDD|nr:acyl-CoA dehydrogenase family protein [Parafrankia sp. BMG5.11]TCJ37047.1 acyl-CoA dehydrogenase [Parafrankia sp. BMG5.11]
MEFAFTEEQAMIADTVRGFFAENATSERTRDAMAQDGIDRALWSAFCAAMGLSGIGLSEEYGGSGLGMVEFAIVAEAAGARVAALPMLGLATAGRAIAAGGSAEQRGEWLPQLVSGEAIAAWADGATVCYAEGRLKGEARFVPHGAIANMLIVHAADDAWLIRADSPGVCAAAHTTMDQTRPLATVTFDDAAAEPLADPASAIAAAQAGGWLCLAAEALGGAQACLDRTVEYARERVQFGRPIGSFQAYKHRLADMMIEIEQARSAVYWAACAVDEESDEELVALHAAKCFCADAFFKCAGDMIQLHGGIAFTWEHDAHLLFKRARSIQSMLGDGEYHREQIARNLLDEAA